MAMRTGGAAHAASEDNNTIVADSVEHSSVLSVFNDDLRLVA
jgi:hypothetical protein